MPLTPHQALARIHWRLGFSGLLIVCALSALVYRAVVLHVLDQEFLADQGDSRSERLEPIEVHRGVITDRNGEPMAVSAPVETVYANPEQINLSRDQIASLASALLLDKKWLEKRLTESKGKQFIYLKRKVAPHEIKDAMALNLPGIYSKREYKRYYPAGEVAAHVVGFTNVDDKGQEGLELSYDGWLQGKPGAKRVLKDRTGRVIKDLGIEKAAVPGNDLQLTLDMRLQYLAYRELKAAVEAHQALSGTVVMLDVNSGEVLAMVNQPSYNPNNRQSLKSSSLRNRAITDVFEPGSTMKVAILAAAIESKKYDLHTPIDTHPGYLRVGRKTIRDHHNYGMIDLMGVMAKSSNIGTSKIALDLSGEVLWEMCHRLGLGQGTGIGFPGESIGYLPESRNWKPMQVAIMSYGYGLSVTPLQLAQAYMILGNGGYKHELSLIKRGRPVAAAQQVLSEETSAAMRQMMRSVVIEGGTGTRAAVPLYEVGGKTGTVHRIGANGYDRKQYRALFSGIAPLNKPEIAVVVVIDSPSGDAYYGGEVAAPVFSRIVSGAMRLLNVMPEPMTEIAANKPELSTVAQGKL